MRHAHCQRLTRSGVTSLGCTHQIHGQIGNVDQGEAVLGPQPAQEDHAPPLLAMTGQPDLLPVALILSGNLNGLPQGVIQILDQFTQLVFAQNRPPMELAQDLAMGHKIGIAPDR